MAKLLHQKMKARQILPPPSCVAGKERAFESIMKKNANAKASAAEQARAGEIEVFDLTTIQFLGMSVTLGERASLIL
jgi:hypothetical protein